jgi:hypothetical protein
MKDRLLPNMELPVLQVVFTLVIPHSSVVFRRSSFVVRRPSLVLRLPLHRLGDQRHWDRSKRQQPVVERTQLETRPIL